MPLPANLQRKCGLADPDPQLARLFKGLHKCPDTIAFGAADPDEKCLLWEYVFRALGDNHLPVHTQGDVLDCVGHAFATALEYLQCVRVAVEGTGSVNKVVAEAIYGAARVQVARMRYGRHFGMNEGVDGFSAAEALSDFGFVIRADYPGVGDLQDYDASLSLRWGEQGMPEPLRGVAHRVANVTHLRTYEQVANAIRNGYPVVVCSRQGFSGWRGANGICEPEGTWAHAMLFIGVRPDPDAGLCCLNSWGDYLGRDNLVDHMPIGSFWVRQSVARSMIEFDQSFSVSLQAGFPPHRLGVFG